MMYLRKIRFLRLIPSALAIGFLTSACASSGSRTSVVGIPLFTEEEPPVCSFAEIGRIDRIERVFEPVRANAWGHGRPRRFVRQTVTTVGKDGVRETIIVGSVPAAEVAVGTFPVIQPDPFSNAYLRDTNARREFRQSIAALGGDAVIDAAIRRKPKRRDYIVIRFADPDCQE